MAIVDFNEDLDIISALSDTPNDYMTAAELKAKFDEGPNKIKAYINETLVPAVENLDTAVTDLDAVKNVTVAMSTDPGTAYNTIVDALDSGAKVWCKYDSSIIIPLTYFLRAPTSNTFIFCGLVGKSQMLWVRLQYYMGGQWSYQFIDLQDKLTFDDAPTEDSTNPVKSGGVYSALALKASVDSPALTGTPKAPTPTEGDNSTKIATTAFVKSAVDYAKAIVIPNDATAQTAWQKADDGIAHGQTVLWTKTDGNNVYILRLAQKKLSTSYEQIGGVSYQVLEETYIFSQLYIKAEHSISVTRSTHTYDGSYTYSASWLGVTNLQAALTFDNAPTSGSNNPVKSGGVYTALSGKQDVLTFDDAPTSESNNPVKSGGVYTAIANIKAVKIDSTEDAAAAYAKAATAYQQKIPCFVEKDGRWYQLTYYWNRSDNIAREMHTYYTFACVTYGSAIDTIGLHRVTPYGGDPSYGWISATHYLIATTSGLPNGAGTYVLKATRASAGATPTLTWESVTDTATDGSTNLITSNGVYDSINGAIGGSY